MKTRNAIRKIVAIAADEAGQHVITFARTAGFKGGLKVWVMHLYGKGECGARNAYAFTSGIQKAGRRAFEIRVPVRVC